MVLLVYMLCFMWIARDSFCRRDEVEGLEGMQLLNCTLKGLPIIPVAPFWVVGEQQFHHSIVAKIPSSTPCDWMNLSFTFSAAF